METNAIKTQLDKIGAQAAHGCGCNDLLWTERFTHLVDHWVASMTAEESRQIMELAVAYGYNDDPMPAGYCAHGFKDDCPCGCFEDDREADARHDEELLEAAMKAYSDEMMALESTQV